MTRTIETRAEDHREVSEAQDHITWLKDQSTSTINYVIKELEDEKAERKQAQRTCAIDA